MAEVRINGQWLSLLAPVGDVAWSTKWGADVIGGPWEASCTVRLDQRSTPSFLAPGAVFEVFDDVSPTPVWGGIMSEPERGEPWTLYARGWGREADRFLALATGSTLIPTTNPRAALNRALGLATNPLHWDASSALAVTDAPITATQDNLNRLTALLLASAKAAGMFLTVGADRVLRATARPTTPTYYATPANPVMGVADDEYHSHLYGRYAKTVTGTPPEAETFGYVVAGDESAAGRWGRSEEEVDLTALGLMAPGAAQNEVNGRLSQVGARMGYTNGLTVARGDLTTVGGIPASLGWVRAGESLRLLNILDPGGNADLTSATDVVIAETSYRAGETTLELAPEGLVARDFASAIAAAVKPDETDEEFVA